MKDKDTKALEALMETYHYGKKEYIPIWKPAITTKLITGERIPTIPIGTKFEVLTFKNEDRKYKYHSARGLPITQIWDDEYELLETHDE